MANTRPFYPQLPLSPPAAPQEADSSGLDPETLALLNQLYPQPQQPQLQTSPNLRLGPLRVPGNAIDAAALAAANQMQYAPRPRNFGQGLAQGLVGGLAQSRASQAVGRSNANQSALDEYQKASDERRKAAATLAIARHGDVPADPDVAKFYNIPEGTKIPLSAVEAARRQLQPKSSAQNEAYIILDTPEKEAAFRKQFPKIPVPIDKIIPRSAMFPTPKEPKPTLSPEDFANDVETDTRGRKYLNVGKYLGSTRGEAVSAARAMGAVPLGTPEADAVTQVDNAKLNIQNLRAEIDGLLPTDPAQRARMIPGIKLSQLFQSNDSRASWGAYRLAAIQALRAAAGSKGLRINQAEIAASTANDIPQITDTYPTAMKRLERLEKMLDNATDAFMVRNRSQLLNQPKEKSIDQRLKEVLYPDSTRRTP